MTKRLRALYTKSNKLEKEEMRVRNLLFAIEDKLSDVYNLIDEERFKSDTKENV